ncbi:MAG: aldo/keto reductase [Christensenellales bacterium]
MYHFGKDRAARVPHGLRRHPDSESGCIRYTCADGAPCTARRQLYRYGAWIYGQRAVLGEALEGGLREKFVIATKSMARTKEAMARDIDISLKNLRTDYIDLYQIHNPSLAELEQVLAPGGALEALMEAKAAGKIRHLGLTAHMAAVFERALELDWVETVMFPYNIVETQGEELMAKCREKNVGFICMKPMAGGALEDARLALRFIRQNENVSVVIPGMYDIREIDENLSAMEDISALTSDELAKIETIRKELGTQFCRRCNYCQPCTAGISISGIFVLEGYLQRYGLGDWAKKRYDALGKKAGDCVGCGACEKRCPYQLPIRQMLARCKQEFGA